jgi:hypothetical protein
MQRKSPSYTLLTTTWSVKTDILLTSFKNLLSVSRGDTLHWFAGAAGGQTRFHGPEQTLYFKCRIEPLSLLSEHRRTSRSATVSASRPGMAPQEHSSAQE